MRNAWKRDSCVSGLEGTRSMLNILGTFDDTALNTQSLQQSPQVEPRLGHIHSVYGVHDEQSCSCFAESKGNVSVSVRTT